MSDGLADSQVMQRVQRGDFAAFDTLVVRYRRALLHAAWSKLGDRAWAEDVVQEAFLAAFAARHSYRPEFPFRTWLWTILLNLCRRQWKRREQRVHKICLQDTQSIPNALQPATHETGLTQMLSTERLVQLRTFLNCLPEAQADALRLRFYGELQFDEIASVMDSSMSAAKVRVKHGLQQLAQLFREADGEL